MNRTPQVKHIPYDDGAGQERSSLGELMSSPAGSKSRWLMLAFAFVATVINYLDRQTLSVLAPVMLERFKISATTYSHIIFAFMLAYTVMNGVSGPLLDRLGSKVGYALTIAWWSAAEILHAFSGGAISLGVFRFLLGVGEAGNFPAGVKVIGEWFPPKERSLASGIFYSGAAVGAMLAPPLLAWSVLEIGWQASFVIVGVFGFVWLGAWLVFYRNPPERSAEKWRRLRLRFGLSQRLGLFGSSHCPRFSRIRSGTSIPSGSRST